MVVMMTCALDFYMATVQKKSAIGCEGGSTEAAVLSARVEKGAIGRKQLGGRSVKIRIINIPQNRIFYVKCFCCAGKLVVL